MKEKRESAPSAVAKGMRILKALAEPGMHRPSSLVRATGLNKATILRILDTLEEERLVVRTEDRGILFGAESFVLAASVSRQPHLKDHARSSLIRLATATEDNAVLMIRSGLHAVCIDREQGDFPMRASYLMEGRRLPLGVGSPSLAILSAMADAEADAILAANADELRRFHRVEPDRIHQDLLAARARGYALATNIVFEGTGGISVPVVGVDGQPVGALTVVAIANRIVQRERLLADLLRQEAAAVNASLMGGSTRR